MLIVLCVAARGAVCDDEPDYGAELPRIPPLAAHAALNSFQFGRDGFELEQVAAEPLVASPVAIDFDAGGRMFVAVVSTLLDSSSTGRVDGPSPEEDLCDAV